MAFISDIHSNLEALKVVLEKLDSLDISDIYCAGDVAGYHSQINECCDVLRERQIPTVMGNHDWYLSGLGNCVRSTSVNKVISYQASIISDENADWLSNLPLQILDENFRMVHGGWSNPIDEYLVPSEEYFSALEGSVFVSGHTHIPTILKFDDSVYCNPGSVGQPRDSDPRASFAVFSDGDFRIERVPYDIDKVAALMMRAGFEEWHYGGLYSGSPALTKIPAERIQTNPI